MCNNAGIVYNSPSWQRKNGAHCFCKFFHFSNPCGCLEILIESKNSKVNALIVLPSLTILFIEFIELKNSKICTSDLPLSPEKALWLCEYSEDIFQAWLESENRRVQIFFRSNQQSSRTTLLKTMITAATKYSLTRTTLHLGIYLLDGFMDTHNIRDDKLSLMAITCLIIAAKVEEIDSKIPKFSELNALTGNSTSTDYRYVERKILQNFKFDLICPTLATFAEYYANRCILLDEFEMHKGNRQESKHYSSFEELLNETRWFLFELIDLTINNINFFNIKPSILAAACVLVVRRNLNITPDWTKGLVRITKYTVEIISPYVDALLSLYNLNENPKLCQTPISNAKKISMDIDSPDSGVDVKLDSDDEFHLNPTVPIKRKRLA